MRRWCGGAVVSCRHSFSIYLLSFESYIHIFMLAQMGNNLFQLRFALQFIILTRIWYTVFFYYYFLVRAIMQMTMTNIVCQVEVELEKLWLWEIECWLASNFIGFLLEQFLIWEEGYEFALPFCWMRFATDKIKLGLLQMPARLDISIYRGCYTCGKTCKKMQ